ncbi:MAG: hypothetical protein WKF30_06585 [Pyrinomonadaceae bacterium]
MATITIEVPDEISELMSQAGDRLPELLTRSLQQPVLPAYFYRYILDFLAHNPSAEEIAAFGPTTEMTERLRTLLDRKSDGKVTMAEKAELDEYERLEHLMIMIKAGNLRYLERTR